MPRPCSASSAFCLPSSPRDVSRLRALPAAAAALAACLFVAAAHSPYAPDVAEPGSVEAIAGFTTDPRFVSPWVAYVPDSPAVPSPSRHLGRVAGAAGELTGT